MISIIPSSANILWFMISLLRMNFSWSINPAFPFNDTCLLCLVYVLHWHQHQKTSLNLGAQKLGRGLTHDDNMPSSMENENLRITVAYSQRPFSSPLLFLGIRLLVLNLTVILYVVYLKEMKHKVCCMETKQQLQFKLVTGLSVPATSCNGKITQRTLSCNIRITGFEGVTCLYCMTELFHFLHYFLCGNFEVT